MSEEAKKDFEKRFGQDFLKAKVLQNIDGKIQFNSNFYTWVKEYAESYHQKQMERRLDEVMETVKSEFEINGYMSNDTQYENMAKKDGARWAIEKLRGEIKKCNHDKEPIVDGKGHEVCPDCGEWGENC